MEQIHSNSDWKSYSKSLSKNWPNDWQAIWRQSVQDLEHSYFLSWSWIEHWLKMLPPDIDITLFHFKKRNEYAACLIGKKKDIRSKIINSNSYYLHYTGYPEFDKLTLEYNLIPATQPSRHLLNTLLTALPSDWDEFHLPALDASSFPATVLLQAIPADCKLLIHREEASRYIDLTAVENDEESYLNLLSSNTRRRIRKAMRGIMQQGDLQLIPAKQSKTALNYFSDMVRLHQKYWQNKGKPGAFGYDWIKEYHQTLIQKQLPRGEIQILQITCGRNTVGYLYNFIHMNKVYYYQSGFNYADYGKYLPGYICHTKAIAYNAELGHISYDFLPSDTQYKKSLSTDANHLVWCTIQKNRFKFKIDRLAQTTKKKIKARIEGSFTARSLQPTSQKTSKDLPTELIAL